MKCQIQISCNHVGPNFSSGERRAGAGPDARGHGAILGPGQVGQPTISAAEGRREQDGVRSDFLFACCCKVLYFPRESREEQKYTI